MTTARLTSLSRAMRYPVAVVGMIIAIALSVGCAPGRESLHELEHVQPEHWPSDLNDAAHKIRQRMQWLAEFKTQDAAADKPMLVQRELVDIIGWIPEIAADTELDESNWSELNSASAALSQQLAGASASFTSASKSIDALCELLQQKQQQLDGLKTAAN